MNCNYMISMVTHHGNVDLAGTNGDYGFQEYCMYCEVTSEYNILTARVEKRVQNFEHAFMHYTC